jgi:hypothetical protein
VSAAFTAAGESHLSSSIGLLTVRGMLSGASIPSHAFKILQISKTQKHFRAMNMPTLMV